MGFCTSIFHIGTHCSERDKGGKRVSQNGTIPKVFSSLRCALEFEAAWITAVASRRLQTEAEGTPGLSKAKSTTAFMQCWLWQVEPLIPDHRLHSSTVPKQNREGFWPSPGSRRARARNSHWPRCRHTWACTGRKGREPAASCSILCMSRSRALGATASAATSGLWILTEKLCAEVYSPCDQEERGQKERISCFHFSQLKRTSTRIYQT